MAWVVIVLGLTGCLFVAKPVETTVVLSTGQTTRAPTGPIAIEVAATVRDRTISIRTIAKQACTTEVFEDIEVVTRKQLGVSGGLGKPTEVFLTVGQTIIGLPIAIVGLGFIGAISVLSLPINGIKVIASRPQRRRLRRVVRETPSACRRDAAGEVTVGMPSGATTRITTDATGRATFEVGADEPPSGTIEIRGASSISLLYFASRARCESDRRAAFASVRESIDHDARTAVAKFPPCEAVTDGPPEPVLERAWLLTSRAIQAAVTDRCADVQRFGREVELIRPALFRDVFAADRAIAVCLAR